MPNSVTLISTKEALAMMPFVTYNGLYRGCKGTDVLTRYPHGLFAKEEIEALLASIIARGESRANQRRQSPAVPEMLV
jgi:hypothetical protein